jgi:outer membrane protein OmpA-like peptidoglycan-associated protein
MERNVSIKQGSLYLLLLLFLNSPQLMAQPNQRVQQPEDAAYKNAAGLQRRGQYKEAIEQYRKSLNEPSNRMGMSYLISKNIEECEYAIKRKSSPEPVTITKLEADVNRANVSNVNAFSGSREQLIFLTSTRPEDNIKGEKRSEMLDHVYMSKRGNSSNQQQWKTKMVGPKEGKRFHEGVLGASPDGKEVFIFRGSGIFFVLNIDLRAEIDSESIGYSLLSKVYNIKLNSNHHISSMIINNARNIIYLCMNDYGEEGGYGGHDIWQIRYDNTTRKWGKLINLGPTINTEGEEVSVSLLSDEKTLFFSSNGYKGFGKFDIYRSDFVDSLDTWGKPTNLGYPINTPNDDIYYSPVAGNPKKAYYTSERADEPGMYDIYLITYYGEILHEEEKEALWLAYLSAIEEAQKITPKKEKFKPKEEVLLAKKGYTPFPTDSVAVGMKIYLQNIQFANAKATLLPKSYKHLEQLYQLLRYYPYLSIEISGHTDDTGEPETNRRLSLERAKSVVNYLVKKGIEEKRMKAKGYSDKQPIAPNKTPEGRALNRRVEFKITGLGEDEGIK